MAILVKAGFDDFITEDLRRVRVYNNPDGFRLLLTEPGYKSWVVDIQRGLPDCILVLLQILKFNRNLCNLKETEALGLRPA